MKTIQRTIVSVYIYTKDNKLLLGKKSHGGVYPDCWHIPGGGVEEGESKEQALVREVREEVGLDISRYPIQLLSDNDRGTAEKTLKETGDRVLVEMAFNNYKVTIDDKRADEIVLHPTDDLVELRWFDLSELSSIKLTPPSEKYFREVGVIK